MLVNIDVILSFERRKRTYPNKRNEGILLRLCLEKACEMQPLLEMLCQGNIRCHMCVLFFLSTSYFADFS